MSSFDTIDWKSWDEALPAKPPAKKETTASSPVAPSPNGPPPGAPQVPGENPAASVPAGKVGKVAGLANKDALGGAVAKLGINPDEILGAMTPRHDVDDILDHVVECLKSADTQEDDGSLQACLAIAEHWMTIAEFLGQNAIDQKKAQFDAQLQLLQHQQQLYQSDQLHQQKLQAQKQQMTVDAQVSKKLADQKVADAKAMSSHKLATQKTAAAQKAAAKTPAKGTAKPLVKKPTNAPREEIPGQGSLFLE